jgi:hypothetical protein
MKNVSTGKKHTTNCKSRYLLMSQYWARGPCLSADAWCTLHASLHLPDISHVVPLPLLPHDRLHDGWHFLLIHPINVVKICAFLSLCAFSAFLKITTHIPLMKASMVYCFSLIYFLNQPLHVSGIFIAHLQEVFTVYVQQLVRVIRFGDWQLAGSGWNYI